MNTSVFGRRAGRVPAFAVLILLIGFLAACDQAVAPERSEVPAATMTSDDLSSTTLVLDENGDIIEVAGDETVVDISEKSGNRIALLVTGRATFDHNSIPEIQLNMRQTEAGEVEGRGRVMLQNPISQITHVTNVTPVCVKPVSGWGRTNYGITVLLHEPFSPHGGMAYTYLTFSVTEDGQLAPSRLLNTRPTCGGSISLYQPENRLNGSIQVIKP